MPAVQVCRTASAAVHGRRAVTAVVQGHRTAAIVVRKRWMATTVVQGRRTTTTVARRRMRAVVLSLALSAAAGASAQAPPLARVATVPVPGPVTALAAGDGLVAAAIGSSVHVIDVTRPESPEVVGRYDFGQPALGVVLDGRLAYVANSHDGLRRLDLSDPAAPVLTGTAPTRGQAVGVAGSGRYLFTADNSIGFDIVDVAGEPTRAGEYLADGFPRGIAAAGSRVFVADQPAGLMVVDASDPASPRVEGGLSLGRDPVLQVFAPDDRSTGGDLPAVVCIVSGRGGLQVVDVSDLSAPRVASVVPVGGPPTGAALWGRRLYVAAGGGLQAFDLTDPAQPVLAASSDIGDVTGPVAVNATHVFAATQDAVDIYRREQEFAP